MDRNIKKNGLINLLALLVIGTASQVLAHKSTSYADEAGLVFLVFGFLVAAISYFQMRLEESERLEKLEYDELKKDVHASTLFTSEPTDALRARRNREQFERWFVPALTILIFLLQAGAAYWLYKRLAKATPVVIDNPRLYMSLYGAFALVLFLLGKYSAGIARLEGQRLLRPAASYMLLGAYFTFIVTLSIAVSIGGYLTVDLYVARALGIVLALTALETLVSLVLEIYRPRVKGKESGILYESRLIGLLAQPEGLFTTAAQVLDYQFGFKVSNTWFFRFLKKALLWLILLQLAALSLSSCFIFIEPGEEGLLERWGSPVAGRAVLKPGPHLKFPWPMDTVIRHYTQQIQSFTVGVVPHPEREKALSLVWTMAHNKEEFNMLVAAQDTATNNPAGGKPTEQAVPVSLLTVSIPVQYRVKDVLAWEYNFTDAGTLLEKLATREVVRYLVGVDLNDIMSVGREAAARELQRSIQKRADELKLGVEVLFVGLQDIHPPVPVADAYEMVIGALQEKEIMILKSESYKSLQVPYATARAAQRTNEASAYALRTVPLAEAKAARFANQIIAYQASPRAYTERAYLAALIRGSAGARKYVLSVTNTHDVILMNLEDKTRVDMEDVMVTPPTPVTK